MTSQNFDVINNILQLVEDNGSKCIDKLGTFKEKISDGVYKYEAIDANVTHFILFENAGKVDEISFYCEKLSFSLDQIIDKIGMYRQGYNFRENYTQFTIQQNAKYIKSIFFIKDNMFVFNDNGSAIEITPQGKRCTLNDVTFNSFCITLNPLISIKCQI